MEGVLFLSQGLTWMGVFGLENMPQGVFSVVRALELPPSAFGAALSLSSRTTGYLDVHCCRCDVVWWIMESDNKVHQEEGGASTNKTEGREESRHSERQAEASPHAQDQWRAGQVEQ